MEQRQYTKDSVTRSYMRPGEYSLSFAKKIRVRKYYAFWISRRARGVEKRSQIVRGTRNRSEAFTALSENAVEIRNCLCGDSRPFNHAQGRPRLSIRARPGVCQHNTDC